MFAPRILLPCLLLGAAPLSARAQIVLPGSQPGSLVDPLVSDIVCGICHGDFDFDVAYEPWQTWSGSMMANAARDPLFWAAVDIANQDVPGAGEFCIRCHAPRGWLEGRSEIPDGTGLEGTPAYEGGDFEGIDCHFCHRMYEGPTDEPFLQNGQYWVDPGDGTGFRNRGPYPDADTAPHSWIYSPYHTQSRFCAACHDLENPLVHLKDETGTDTGLLFPEQATYHEWEQSDFPARDVQCQTCHMADVAGYVCSDQFIQRDDIAKHEFNGANVFMTGVLKNLYGASLGRTAAYDRSINLALDQLQNHSADLTVQVPSRVAAAGDVQARVRVTNLTGHKLPTGYPEGRRMWLSVVVQDGLGGTLYESGHYDDATATLVADPDLVVYETTHGRHGVGASFHLVLNDRIFFDNRIPPAGFRPDLRTQPVGYTFPVQADGSLANWDDRAFPFTIPEGTTGPITVTASLWYQTASKPYIDFLRDENVSGPDPFDPDPMAPSRGEKMHAHWDTNGRSAPVLMRSVTRRIRLDLAPPVTALAPDSPVPLLRAPEPNPFRDRTEVRFSLPAAAESRLAVFDVTGRRVRELAMGVLATGEHRVVWDGRDDAGRLVGTGSYFLRLETAGTAPLVTRVLVIR